MTVRPRAEGLLPELARRAAERPAVVLDDDPTGTQTLRDVFVLTRWDALSIARRLDDPVVFLSTNTRSLDEAAAVAITRDAARAAVEAGGAVGRPVSIVSRSDSTLRGHFPAETEAIAEAIDAPQARVLLAPYFGDGGRVTVGDVHFVERAGERRPVAETEFARDTTFGYRSSNLRQWVAEKYEASGRVAPPMTSLSLELIRAGGPDAVAAALANLAPRGVAIANAELDRDIEVVALGALIAESGGVPLVARTAASYVRARAGRAPAPLVTPGQLAVDGPGVIVVGSHVATTSRQLDRLLAVERGRIVARELGVEALLGGDEASLTAVAAAIDRALGEGRCALVATERAPRDVGLDRARAISEALVDVVRRVARRPAWVIAKGGITSHDVASRGLAMSEARVAGQLLPGVPVWVGAASARWPGVPLVVFPGNVGSDDALVDAVRRLSGRD